MYANHDLDTVEQLPGYAATRDSDKFLRQHRNQAGAVLQPLSTTFSRRAKAGGYDNEPTENHSYRVNVGENQPLVDIEADVAREREQQRQVFMARELERQLQVAEAGQTGAGLFGRIHKSAVDFGRRNLCPEETAPNYPAC
jgi:hypothetical protein